MCKFFVATLANSDVVALECMCLRKSGGERGKFLVAWDKKLLQVEIVTVFYVKFASALKIMRERGIFFPSFPF